MPGEGQSASGIGYMVHGAGCRMTDDAGQVLDFDMVRDPVTGESVEAFDAWRVRWFLDPDSGCPSLSNEIETACLQLARQGELRKVPGQQGRRFTLPG